MTNNKKMILNEDTISRNMLNKLRESVSKKTNDAIAITDDPKFGQEVLKNQIAEFRASVDGGAEFSNINTNSPSESPLVYIPSTGNLVFGGTIPSMNDLKWQFSLKDADGSGLFIWSNGLRLNEQNLKTLNKLHGFYLNWKNQWEQSGEMLETLNKEF